MKRVWSDVEAKHRRLCRVAVVTRSRSHCDGNVEFAHVTPRRLDTPLAGTKVCIVNPLDIVPLCKKHHDRFDGRQQPRLDLLPYLKLEEQMRAVERIGNLARAYKHVTNER